MPDDRPDYAKEAKRLKSSREEREAHSLSDQIAAEKHEAQKLASKSPQGFRLQRFKPGGTGQ